MSDGGIFDEPDSGSHDAELPIVEPTIHVNKSKKQLICVADQTGNPLVATAKYDSNGELALLEPYRRPSQKEWLHLNQTGQIVKQGPGNVKVSSVGDTTSTEPGWKKPLKIVGGLAGLAAVVGGGFWLFRRGRKSNPETISEMYEPEEPDEPDDDDDDGDDDDED